MLASRLFNWRFLTLFGLLALLLGGCGGSSSDSGDAAAVVSGISSSSPQLATTTETAATGGAVVATGGSLALMLTDAPSDEFTEINLTVNSVELLTSDGGRFEIFNGREVVNLLGLRNFSNLFAVSHDVPPGLYTKIRMHLEDVELVRSDVNGVVTERIHPKLVANGKLDLNPRTAFAIGPGKSLVLQIDMDAKKSIQLHATGGKGKGNSPAGEYRFRPVVFIDVVDMVDYGGKLVRVTGEIAAMDAVAGTVEFCTSYSTYDKRCVIVKQNSGTKIYDKTGALITLATKQVLTYGIAVGYMSLVNGKNYLNAEVVELGYRTHYMQDFMHVEGNVMQLPVDDSNVFYFGVRPGFGFVAGDLFRVVPMAGAKLFSSSGAQLPWSSLTRGKVVEVEGLLDATARNPYLFRATIVYIDMSMATTQIAGSVASVDSVSRSLMLTTADMGDLCVVVGDAVNIYQINGSVDVGYSGQRISFDQIRSGQRGDIYGHMGSSGCYVADDILVQ